MSDEPWKFFGYTGPCLQYGSMRISDSWHYTWRDTRCSNWTRKVLVNKFTICTQFPSWDANFFGRKQRNIIFVCFTHSAIDPWSQITDADIQLRDLQECKDSRFAFVYMTFYLYIYRLQDNLNSFNTKLENIVIMSMMNMVMMVMPSFK